MCVCNINHFGTVVNAFDSPPSRQAGAFPWFSACFAMGNFSFTNKLKHHPGNDCATCNRDLHLAENGSVNDAHCIEQCRGGGGKSEWCDVFFCVAIL